MPLNGNFDQNILQKIKEKHLHPKPRWQFLLKEYFIWIFSTVLMLIGGLAFSLIIYLIKNNDWDIYLDIYGSLAKFMLLTLPYVWIILLVLFYFAAQYYLKHTRTGYRYTALAISAITIPASIVFGIVLYATGSAEFFNEALIERVPYYERFGFHPVGRWQNPGSGMLAGEILDFDESDLFELNDMRGELWIISGKNTAIVNIPEYQIGIHVRMLGKLGDGHRFYAEKILMSQPPIELFFHNKNYKIQNPQYAPQGNGFQENRNGE
jgi:hypothetical protein